MMTATYPLHVHYTRSPYLLSMISFQPRPSLPNDQLKVSLRRRAHHHGLQSRFNYMDLSKPSRNFLNRVTKKMVHLEVDFFKGR